MIAVVILAAGASVRMGTPKQLLRFGSRTLLRGAADAALESAASTTLIVLGANAESIRAELRGLPVELVENPRWQDGIGTSICAGIAWLLANHAGIEGAVLMVCDQPHTTHEIIDKLIETFSSSGKRIVASAYESTLGVPALFSRDCFPELLEIAPDEGAKRFIIEHRDTVAEVSFPGGSIDLDTSAEYERWLRSQASLDSSIQFRQKNTAPRDRMATKGGCSPQNNSKIC